ncbi:MAG: hypothetical protein CME70_15325 [Halobacteriovorax sp.]|nr:hypothetical protein [Halobacteriovorax sp.]|tara:strand:- start:65059 stop:66345 length:1287 start_codon:yes stop_codon:yes gene_type:complete
MKSWSILAILILPVFTQAQVKKPLSSKVEELLKAKQEQRAREEATVEKIGKDAVFEALENERQRKIRILKEKKISKAVKSRFSPKTPFLNYRPPADMFLWRATLSYGRDSYETNTGSIKKELNESSLKAENQIHYSWTKKTLFKYTNTFHVFQTTQNDLRQVNGATVTPDPDITNGKFGDHLFEYNYRSKREIFYGYDLDYFIKLAWPFGEASRAYAFGTGAESTTSTTTASQDGNLKSSFGAQPHIGIDYFSGKERSRYNIGASVAYAMKGRYIRNKGTGFWSSNPTGLIVKTSEYTSANIWFNYQKRPDILKRTFYGFGANAFFTTDQEERILTTGADGLSWDQTDKIQGYFKFKLKGWVKYMLKNYEHIESGLIAHVPYSYKIKREVLDESADTGGNRVVVNNQTTEKVKGRMPIEIYFTYAYSF